MVDAKLFLSQTAQTASFALREYFRPLVVSGRFVKSWLVLAEPAESAAEDPIGLEVAKAVLRQRLARGRRSERLLLLQGIISAIGSLLALAISLMSAFDSRFPVVLAILIPGSVFAVWILVRLVQSREEIVELKTIRWVLQAVDPETAEQVAKQVASGKSAKRRKSPKNKKPS